jgi:hypothetical protein
MGDEKGRVEGEYSKQSCKAVAGAERRNAAMERREEAAAAGLGREAPRLRRRSRRATVWGLIWAKTAARVSSEDTAASMSV